MNSNDILIANTDDLRSDMDYLEKTLLKGHRIDPNLYEEYDVKRGLRDSTGRGVLTGLTEVSDVCGFDVINGRKIPAEGGLYYQGINVNDLINGLKGKRFGFEETTFLLLFGRLPKKDELEHFLKVLSELEDLSGRFVRDVVMKASSSNIMNALQRCVLTLYTYDENPEDISVENALRQALELIAKLPLIAVYSYHAYRHFRKDETLLIRNPEKGRSLAENILYMLRPDGQYTELEAKVLDVALILHAEHGGGNNSTFTTHVVTSSGTDTYSAIAASIGSLKGPRHGGANLKAQGMFDDIKKSVKDWTNEDEIREYLRLILDKKAFDKTGLIYGMGHAVYTISDPREKILKSYAQKLASEKGLDDEFALYDRVERIAGEEIMTHRNMLKPVCANVDFYSGFVYTMLNIPEELFTPLFAIARITGWSAHRLEELLKGADTHLLILESIQDPGNLGTMLRTGEGAGISGVVMNHTTVDLFNPKTIRSTMGSIYRMPFFVTRDLAETICELKNAGVKTYAAHLKGKMQYDEPDYTGATAFMIGNEGNGLSDEIADLADTYIKIPMCGQVESLNAAISASLLMYETNRQRRIRSMSQDRMSNIRKVEE